MIIEGLADISQITFVKLPWDGVRQQQKEFAFVDFETEADAKEALEKHEEVGHHHKTLHSAGQMADCDRKSEIRPSSSYPPTHPCETRPTLVAEVVEVEVVDEASPEEAGVAVDSLPPLVLPGALAPLVRETSPPDRAKRRTLLPPPPPPRRTRSCLWHCASSREGLRFSGLDMVQRFPNCE